VMCGRMGELARDLLAEREPARALAR